MTDFNVLDRAESMHRHLMLEASAGTGKTFAIENMVVRLLLETDGDAAPLLIENILVVTFTKIAAGELKERIHSTLEKSLGLLKEFLVGVEVSSRCPDYLLAHIELGEEAVQKAKKAIETALFSFDKSQIFTIHGFCWRMLKNYAIDAEISLEASSREDQSLSVTRQLQIVRDFLRWELLPSVYSPGQLKIIQGRFKDNSLKFQRELLNVVNRGIDIESTPPFSEQFEIFCGKMKALKESYRFESSKIIEDFYALAPCYTKLADRSGTINPENIAKAMRFAALFDKDEWETEDLDVLVKDGLFFLECFVDSLLKKGKISLPSDLHYPGFLDILREHLEPLVSKVGHEATIFSRMASDCQKFLTAFQEREEMMGHTDLLVQMRKAIDKPSFANRVRSDFSAAIVDEFQDTDPVQWEIFSQLFVPQNQEWKGHLYLVGDPKQSIYAFRQADIYTYLDAAQRLGTGAVSTLGTNFRSTLSLIDGLNALFGASSDTFPLPKLSDSLQYREVKAGRNDAAATSGQPSLHFWEVKYERVKKTNKIPIKSMQSDFLFPAIVKEILKLNEQEGIGFGQFAILIANKHQAAEVCEYLREHGIPVKNQRGADIIQSHAVAEMRDLLNGVLNYGNRSAFNVALAGRLIGLTHLELQLLNNEEILFRYVKQVDGLKTIFYSSGFAAFFSAFMRSFWHADGKSVLERLLREASGLQFLREWQDLADLLIAEEQSGNLLPHGVVAFLDELEELSENEDERIKVYVDPDEDGVSVMTTFISKGLEFDIVIALGLINERVQKTSDLIALEKGKGYTLCSIEDKEDPLYLKFCEESDAEKMRQLYVALTRAKDRLYVPFAVNENPKEIPIGSASPMDLFIAKLDKPPTDYLGLYNRIASEDGSTISNIVARHPEKFSLQKLCKQETPLPKRKPLSLPKFEAPEPVKIPSQLQVIQSFTSLSHTKTAGLQEAASKATVPHDFDFEDKNEHTLPSGSDTGILLHKIFENIPFDAVRKFITPKDLGHLIAPFLKGTRFVPWEEVIAKIVFTTLTTDLGDGFCLADIAPKKIYRETEFLYPCDPRCSMLGDTTAMPGYLKGVVDVFFEHRGKFYLLDWKSNWLGPSHEYYCGKHLEEAMTASHYDLQAAIYREAFERYLNIFDKRSFEDKFGGVFYLFVRGMGVESGIFSIGAR